MIRKRVDAEFVSALAEKLKSIDVSQTAAEPAPALEALDRLLGEAGGERRIVYLISDFRARQWDEPTDLKQRLARLSAADVELRLVDCVNAARPNLAIVSLEPVEGIQAAGVPWLMGVRVRNFGATPAKDVPVLLVEDGRARPALRIAEIPPGRVVQERFPVFFPLAGQHRIAARLESDAVAADNFRFAVVDLPADVPVLLVDGDPAAGDAYYLSKALASGEAPTGIRPRIETPRFLADKPLDRFQAINVANVDRLDQSAIRALERYVAEGGGVAFFLGPRCDSRFINESLYRRGEGLFPLPLAGEAELPVDRLEKAPDVEADASHFVFRVFAETRNSFLNSVTVERYFACKAGWKPPTGSTVRVLARLRNGAPLVVERSFGKGRVVAMLSTAAPQWNNWARNPSFVVAMLDLQAHLAGRARRRRSGSSGNRWKSSSAPPTINRRSVSSPPTPTPRRPRWTPCAPPTGNGWRPSSRPIEAASTRPSSPGPTERSKSAARRSTSMRRRATCGRCSAPSWPPGSSRRSSISSTRRRRSSWPLTSGRATTSATPSCTRCWRF